MGYNCKTESNKQTHLKTSSSCADDYLPEKVIDDNLDDDQAIQDIESEQSGNIVAPNAQYHTIPR